MEPKSLLVFDLHPSKDASKKPRELIQISGHEVLSLVARRAITVLWHSAHRQGIENGKDYEIEINELRPSNNRSNAIVVEAIEALMKTLVTVTLPDGSTRRVQFLGGNDLDAPDRPHGVLTYSFDKRLIEILQDSTIWGSISLPVIMSLSGKYAISLYEIVAQWTNLSHKTYETLSIEELRTLLGVESKKYPLFGSFNKHILQPALVEINALAPFNVRMLLIKTGKQTSHVRIFWSKKNIDEHKEAWDEMQRSKTGRRARITSTEEFIVGPASGLTSLTHKNGQD